MTTSAFSRRYSPVWLPPTISTFGALAVQPGDELVVAVGGGRRAQDALDLEHLAAVATEDRLGDVLAAARPMSLLSAPMCWVTGMVTARSSVMTGMPASSARCAAGVSASAVERGQQQDVDALGDQVVDVGGLLVAIALTVGHDDLDVGHERLARRPRRRWSG